MKQYRTYTIRLFPDKRQIQQLQELSLARNTLYNILIDIENESYENTNKIKTEFDLDKKITVIRKTHPLISKLNSKACQRVAKEVYGSYKSFFNLIKKDNTACPPHKIENIEQFHSIVYNQTGWKFIDNNILKLNGVELKYKGIPNIEYKNLLIKEVKLKRINNKYLLDLSIEFNIQEFKHIDTNNKVLAIDLGIKNLVNGIDNDGHWIRFGNRAKKTNDYFRKEISKVQSKMDKCIKKSNRHKKLKKVKKKLYTRKNAQIKQTLHIQSKKLANMNYKTIVVGDLAVKKLMQKESNKLTKTSRSFGESSIATFMDYLAYKYQLKNTKIITIGEQWTTQQNCLTGKLFKDKVKLDDRTVMLNNSIVIDRDLNAAINILKRYEQNHIALLTVPLDVSSVVNKYNLLTNT